VERVDPSARGFSRKKLEPRESDDGLIVLSSLLWLSIFVDSFDNAALSLRADITGF